MATDAANATMVERTGVRLSRATTTPTREAMTRRRQISASVRVPGKRGLRKDAGGVGTDAVAGDGAVGGAATDGDATAVAAVSAATDEEGGAANGDDDRAGGGRTPTPPARAPRPKSDADGTAAEPAPEKTISYEGGTPPGDAVAGGGTDGKKTPTRAAAPTAHDRSAHTGVVDGAPPSARDPPSSGEEVGSGRDA